jgi:hypothetical protein
VSPGTLGALVRSQGYPEPKAYLQYNTMSAVLLSSSTWHCMLTDAAGTCIRQQPPQPPWQLTRTVVRLRYHCYGDYINATGCLWCAARHCEARWGYGRSAVLNQVACGRRRGLHEHVR